MFKLELRLYGNSSAVGSNLRVCFENLLAAATHSEDIKKKASSLGGQIINDSLIYFTSAQNLLEMVRFITTL